MPRNYASNEPLESVLAEIIRAFKSPQPAMQAEFRELIEQQAGPIYGTSPEYPGKIVERRPDGSQVCRNLARSSLHRG